MQVIVRRTPRAGRVLASGEADDVLASDSA